jgi:MFS family permease
MTADEKKILFLTSAAHFLTHFFVLVFPALVMPISRDLGIPPAEVLPIGFPMYLCFGVLALPWGYLSDRLGARWAMGAGLVIAGAGLVLAGRADSVPALTLFLAVTGVGCSAFHPSGLALVSRGIRVRGRAMGVMAVWGSLGIAAAPFAAGSLNYLVGWGDTLSLLGLLGVVLGAACLLITIPLSEPDLQRSSEIGTRQAATFFLVMCVAMVFSGLMYRGYTVILPRFFEARLSGLEEILSRLAIGGALTTPDSATVVATLIASGVYLVGMVGQYLGGRAADRYDLRRSYLCFFAAALPFLVSMRYLDGPLLVAATAAFILFSLGMQPIENSLVAVITPARWRSVGYGVKFTLLFGAGSLAVHLVSMVEGAHGLDAVILLLAGFLVAVVALLLLLLFLGRGVEIRHEQS